VTQAEWTVIDSPDRWAELMSQLRDAPAFQTWGWGEFQRRGGWKPLRLARLRSNDMALAQVLCRRMPGGIEFAWVPGGPVSSRDAGLAQEMRTLHSAVESIVGRCYLRCNVMTSAIKTDFFASNSFMVRARRPVNSRYSIFLRLHDDEDQWLLTINKKHRYYVRLALRQGLTWTINNRDENLDDLATLLKQMVNEKNISIPVYSGEQLRQMRDELGDGVLTIIGSQGDQPVTGALVVIHGDRAHYLAAATSEKGREMSAAYGMLFELRKSLRSRGVRLFDLGGIAPHDKAASGVDHFKLGFGGETVEYLGEWDAGTRFSRALGNSAVTRMIRSTSASGSEMRGNQRVEWSTWDGPAEQWDEQLKQLPGWSVYQSYQWGEHRKRFGWTPIRLIAKRNNHVVGMLQVQTRRYLSRIGLAWSPGGPVGDVSACGSSMRAAIAQASGARYLVYRLNVMRLYGDVDAATMAKNGWTNSQETILSGLSLTYDLSASDDSRERLLTKNWRHNLRRGLKRNITAYHWQKPDPMEMTLVYDQMHSYKGIEHLAQQNSLESISSLLTAFNSNCIIVRCDDADGNMIALRGALIMGDRAWDTFAAATPEGRKQYASYVAFWELMRLCKMNGVESYDMGGADPINNRGVYDFKQGTGARVVRFLGEWEYSQPRVLGLIAGRRIAARMG
jgi:lipid II:glycine glycyltransferase (peptidoglycan interpeptide bridge formation enzyme)